MRLRPPTSRDLAAPVLLGLVCLISAAAAPRNAWPGVVTVSPTLEVDVRDEQPPSASVPEGSLIARLTPQLALARVGTTTLLELRGLRSFDSHTGFEGPQRVTDAAGLNFLASLAPYSTLTAHAGYFSSRDPLVGGSGTPVTTSESAIATGGARLETWRLDGGYEARAHTYDQADESDGLSHNWDVAAFPFRRPDTRALVAWHGRDLNVDGALALTTRTMTLGYRRTHFPGLSSELELGAAATRDRAHGTNSWDFAGVAGAAVERGTLWIPLDVRFQVAWDFETTGFVEASLPGYRALLAVRLEQTLGAEGGVFRDPTLARYMTVEARDTLGGQYVVRLEGSFGQTRSYFEPDLWLRTQRAWASLSRRVAPWLTAGVDYSFVNQEAAESVPSWAFQRSRVGIRLTMGAQ